MGLMSDIEVGVVNAYLELQDRGFFDTLNRASSALQSFEDNSNNGMSSLEKVSRLTGDIGQSMYQNITVPAVRAGKAIVGAYESTESAFTGVRKTINEEALIDEGKFRSAEEGFKALNDAIWQMTQETGSSYEAIAGVMEMAGQLNVPIGEAGKSIIDFTKNIIMLNDTTDLLGADAAKDLAQFMNIMNTSAGDVNNLGATIVDLGNNSATTEASIVSMAMRLAGAGSSIGLTEPQVLAISAALSSVGITAEMGGSAFSKAMKKMQVAAETGYEPIIDLQSRTGLTLREIELMSTNDAKGFIALADSLGMTTTELKAALKAGTSLNDFAEVANMTTEDFVKLWRQDAVSAIEAFVIGLGDTETHGASTIQMLQEMGFTEVRLSDVLTRMSLAQGEFTRELELANKAWNDGTALTEEAEKRYGDLSVQISQLRETWKSLEVDLAEIFVPVLREIIDILKSVIEHLKGMPDWLKKILVEGTAILALVGPLFLGVSKITGAILNVIKFLDMIKGFGIVQKLGEITSAIGGGSGGGIIGVLKSVGSLIGGAVKTISGIGLAIGGIITAVKNFFAMWQNGWNGLSAILEAIGLGLAAIGAVILGAPAAVAAAVAGIALVVSQLAIVIHDHWDSIKEWGKETLEKIEESISKFGEWLSDFLEGVGDFFEGLWQSIVQGWKNFKEGFMKSIRESISNIAKVFTGIPEWIKEHIVQPIKDALSDGFQAEDILTIGKALIEGLFNGILFALKYLNPLYWLWTFVVKPIIDAVRELFGIHSPSTVFAEIGGNLIEGLFKGISDTWEKIVDFFKTAFDSLVAWFKGLFSKIHDTVLSVWETISSALKEIFNRVREWVSSLIDGVIDWLGEMKDRLRQFFSNISKIVTDQFNHLRDTIHGAFEKVKEVIDNVISGIKEAFESLIGFLKDVIGNIKDVITKTINFLKEAVSKAIEAIKSFFSNVISTIKSLWEAVTDFIGNVFSKIFDFFKEKLSQLWNWVKEFPKKFVEIGKDILTNLWEGLKSVWESVKSWFEEKFGWISDIISKVKSAFSGITDAVGSILPGHANGLDYVPYDNYVARLHKGERVLTKAENEAYNSGNGSSGGDTFNFYNTQPDPYEYARQMKRTKKELALIT